MLRALYFGVALFVAQTTLADTAAYRGARDIVADGITVTVRHHHDWSRIPSDDGGWRLVYSAARPFGVDLDTSDLKFYSPPGVLVARVPSPPLTYLEVSRDGRYVIGLSEIKFLNPTQLVVFNQNGELLLRRQISAQVYCFDRKGYQEMERMHRDAFEELQRYAKATYGYYGWKAGDRVYLDIREGLSERNWHALFPDIISARCKSPLSRHFSESVTNWIHWYDDADPRPHVVEKDGQPYELRLRDPKGIEFGVPFKLLQLHPELSTGQR